MSSEKREQQPDGEEIRPWMLPENFTEESLSKGLQAAYSAILNPLYKELVIDEKDPLVRSFGL